MTALISQAKVETFCIKMMTVPFIPEDAFASETKYCITFSYQIVSLVAYGKFQLNVFIWLKVFFFLFSFNDSYDVNVFCFLFLFRIFCILCVSG